MRRWQMGDCGLTPRECRAELAVLGLTRAEIDHVMRLVERGDDEPEDEPHG